jgi:hypothetical protein
MCLKTQHLFLVMLALSICITSCNNNYIEDRITISPERSEESVHIGKGVWMEIPKGYAKAYSFDGYQTSNMNSSISIKMFPVSIEKLKSGYNPSVLKKKKTVLLELSPVNYGDKENGFLSVVHDKKTNTIRYLLAIRHHDKTYNIKAFCFAETKETYDPKIRRSLLSTYIGSVEESEEPFKLADIKSFDELIFTRDGQYPTMSEDNSVIEWKNMESLAKGLESGLVANELQKLTGHKSPAVTLTYLSNGKYYSGTAITEDKKAYVGLTVSENKEGTLVKCYGNKNSSLEEFEKFALRNLVKTTIRGR